MSDYLLLSRLLAILYCIVQHSQPVELVLLKASLINQLLVGVNDPSLSVKLSIVDVSFEGPFFCLNVMFLKGYLRLISFRHQLRVDKLAFLNGHLVSEGLLLVRFECSFFRRGGFLREIPLLPGLGMGIEILVLLTE